MARAQAPHPRPVRPAASARKRSPRCGLTFLTSRITCWLQVHTHFSKLLRTALSTG